ncbi:hypothetical protein [Leifsonia sp. 2MCAF36]|uniref:hypothetical protein n=1 Tax=Leifsonia sp. 2MCAF36 TaxID=3232988 RepID=UPI003F9541B8
MAFLAYVDGIRYPMSDQDVDSFERAVVAALRSGGDFVAVTSIHRGTVRILITSGSTVRIEKLPEVDESEQNGDERDEFFDFAFYDYEP